MTKVARILLTLLLSGLMPHPAAMAAEGAKAMTGAEFGAYVTGRTLDYAQDGQLFGTEKYLPGRRVVWAFAGAPCQFGHWFEKEGAICFAYDGQDGLQCWQFHRSATGLVARYMAPADAEAGQPSTELAEVGDAQKPLVCPGPDLGV